MKDLHKMLTMTAQKRKRRKMRYDHVVHFDCQCIYFLIENLFPIAVAQHTSTIEPKTLLC